MQRLAISGMSGFLGWHTACRLRALRGIDAVDLDRSTLSDGASLAEALEGVDGVIHIAGVNRAKSDSDVEQGNIRVARELSQGLIRAGRSVPISYANSIQAASDSAYGRGKAAAAEILRETSTAIGSTFGNVILPNLFGEHGRPHYNSFVATFADNVVTGTEPVVNEDRPVSLLHVQDAAHALIEGLMAPGTCKPAGEEHGVAEIATLLKQMHAVYGLRGELPPLNTRFEVNLFNTYRAAAWPNMFPITPPVHSDDRGALFEAARSHGGTGQVFASITRPGAIRGEHYHLHKIERFAVIRGEAEIKLRRLFSRDVVRFRVSGDAPSFIDMPTLWVHNIRNVGHDELVTLFWADQLLDPENPDQYPERVCP